jgi:hypothetical protein
LKPELLSAIRDCAFEHPSEGVCAQAVLLAGNQLPWHHHPRRHTRLCVTAMITFAKIRQAH